MSKMHHRKRLYCDSDVQPTDWPKGWPFPAKEGTWAPGYPRKMAGEMALDLLVENGVVVCLCLDGRGEGTDLMEGEFIHVNAVELQSGNPVRLKPLGSTIWSEAALLRITTLEDGRWGCRAVFDFEPGESKLIRVSASVYGVEDIAVHVVTHRK